MTHTEASSGTVDRLIHAVLMPSFVGPNLPQWVVEAAANGLGGVCYFGHNVDTLEQLRAVSDRLHAAGSTATMIDEEGGTVSRLRPGGESIHVGHAVLGRADDVALTRGVAGMIAAELDSAGVDVDLAPVADVNTNPANPVIGIRSFGADPLLVARHAAAFVDEMQERGVAACAKHFPGHGDTDVDSHLDLPFSGADPERLRGRELVPFEAVVGAGARCVMTAHIVVAGLDDRPATVSPSVVGLLRDELGFDGVIVSDAMDMRAVSATIGFGEGVVQALTAGVDLVALGNPVTGLGRHASAPCSGYAAFAEAFEAVREALRTGRLSTARLTEAATRVGELVSWCREPAGRPADATGTSKPRPDDVAAERALRTRGDVAGMLSEPVHVVDARRRANPASGERSSAVAGEVCARLPGSTEGPATGIADDRLVIVLIDGVGPDVDSEVEAVLTARPDSIVICVGWSAVDEDLPHAANAVFAFGDSAPTARAVADLLIG